MTDPAMRPDPAPVTVSPQPASPPMNDAPPIVPAPSPSDATLPIDAPEKPVGQPGTLDSAPTVDAAVEASAGGITADQARVVLRRVKDPELNLNIVDLGLVYDVAVDGSVVRIDMSLTSPGCPSGPEIMGEAEQQLRTIPGVSDVVVNLVWSPPWTPERIEPRVRAYMGF